MKGGRSKGKKADDSLAVKNSRVSKKPVKKGKDPNAPKKPASAFFVFMEEFRQTYKEKFPNNKSVAVVGKAGGAKWKSMSDAEKAPYAEKSEKRKEEYNKLLKAYNSKGDDDANEDENESDKSKSEVNDEEGTGESGDVGEDDD